MASQHLFKVGKLIRDKLPATMRSSGIKVFEHTLDQEEYIKRLKDKLLEEVQEALAATNLTNLQEELADVLEVIMALSHVYGLSFEEIETIRAKKKSEKGGFEAQIYVDHIEIDSDNPRLKHYLAKPEQYPEIQ